jgi:hypothetical protein
LEPSATIWPLSLIAVASLTWVPQMVERDRS